MNLENIKDIDTLIEYCKEHNWQDFEKLTSFILEKNDFKAKHNIVKTKNKKRRQYDVIAEDINKIILIDCKKWSNNRYKSSALKTAIKKHIERVNFYKNFTKKEIIPLIVTQHQEDILFHENVPIIPISKLNWFLNELE